MEHNEEMTFKETCEEIEKICKYFLNTGYDEFCINYTICKEPIEIKPYDLDKCFTCPNKCI